ncbi:MAG: hypothetical protein ACRDPA_04160, partial [Solirubrobacteraceae bacterium]
MSLFLPELERQLREVIRSRSTEPDHDHHRRRVMARFHVRGPKRTISVLPVLGSVLVTVAIVVVALLAFKPGHTANSAARPSSAPSSRQHLIQMLGVLRTPQTEAARDPSLLFGGPLVNPHGHLPTPLRRQRAKWGNPILDRSLVRVVKVPGFAEQVGVIPASYQPSLNSPQRLEGIELTLKVSGLAGLTGTGPRPTSVPEVQAHGLAIS